jgi:formylglycine-generating enzyme required for sulfatase activity
VSFAAPFFLARTEVPSGVYERVMRKQLAQSGSRLLPATQVSWSDADDFARAVRLRLPSEAEWEYACRAGTTTPYWSGDQDGTLTKAGWTKANSGSAAHAVAEIGMSNEFGLFDMHGNVWEWCEDTWHENYRKAPTDGSAWVDSTSQERIVRGGSADKDAKAARSSYRNHRPIETRGLLLGFRAARSVTND